MKNLFRTKWVSPGLTLFLCAASLRGGETRGWVQSDYSDFEKGIFKNLSLRSDGLLTLAPRFQELYDTSSGYLWALAQDSKGDLFAGGGPGAKLFRLTPKGDKKVLADLDGLEIHAIAVDRQDRVYAATSPDGKVYRVSASGKSEVFYDPKAKYIWAMAFGANGDLFVATGDHGEIHRVTPDGKGSVFFKSDETHARSLAIDSAGNLIVGTDPGGLVLRISPSGEGFVLYQMAKKEVTAVALGSDGSIYAAAVGTKQPSPPAAAPVPIAPVPIPSPLPGTTPAPRTVAAHPPALSGTAVSISGGSDVYRIDKDGNPRKIWTNAQDIVYTLALDSAGRVLLGTGNKGYIYRIDSAAEYTVLLNGSSTQVTSFLPGRNGHLYATTGNVGKIFEIGPGLEHEGSIESEVFDAGIFSQWGRLSFDANLRGGTISIAARSGNLDTPQKNWSPWSAPVTVPKGARVGIPPARFAQWKAVLTASATGESPGLEAVELDYLPKNVEPRIEQIEITPTNYKFPVPSAAVPPAQTLSLPPLSKRRAAPAAKVSAPAETTTPAMQYAKGWVGARWNASDENGDTLVYTVQIRGVGETEWKPLKANLKEKYLSWDTTAYPDGEYRIRVIASDAPSNPPSEALTVAEESDPFLIDNTPPRITGLAASRNGNKLEVRFHAADALSNIKSAEYSVDGGEWTVAPPVGSLSDSPELDYKLTVDVPPGAEHTVAVRVQDEYDNQAADKVVVK